MAKALLGSAVFSALATLALPAFSQTDAPATAAYAEPAPAAEAPPAAAAAPAAPAAQPAAPAPAAPPPASPPPSDTRRSYADDPSPQADGYNVGHSGITEPPAPPPREEREGKGFELPDMSIRVDPLNWIIYGRLGLELEAAVWNILSVELVPVFVTSSQPPYMNLSSFPGTLEQKSNGLGAMSGASIGAGFWLSGKPFVGTVLRFYYTNYGYQYTSKYESGAVLDEVKHTERHLALFIGSHQKWGPFTIATGIGLGVEMNREKRCFDTNLIPSTTCNKDVFDILIQDGTTSAGNPVRNPYSLNGGLHPVYFNIRLSLGFVF